MASAEATTLAAMKRRFTGREGAVERAFEGSESFRALCRDYLACAAALARWRESGSEEGQLRAAEYSELLTELTSEIDAQLRRAMNARPDAGRARTGRK